MAAGDSRTSIANLALSMVGEDPISNLDNEPSKRGRYCRQFYDTSRRAMLAAAPWREAKKEFQAAAQTTPPLFHYSQAYPVPADYIRMVDLESPAGRWELMNVGDVLCIVSNDGAPLDEYYIFDLEDPTLFNPLLTKSIAADIAVNLAWPLARDMSLKEDLKADREAYLVLARTVSGQQASPRIFAGDGILRARW